MRGRCAGPVKPEPGLIPHEGLVAHRQPAQGLLESRHSAHTPPMPSGIIAPRAGTALHPPDGGKARSSPRQHSRLPGPGDSWLCEEAPSLQKSETPATGQGSRADDAACCPAASDKTGDCRRPADRGAPVPAETGGYFKMLTARAITSPRIIRETTACTVITNLAQRVSGITSVGLNAVASVKPR